MRLAEPVLLDSTSVLSKSQVRSPWNLLSHVTLSKTTEVPPCRLARAMTSLYPSLGP